MRLHKPTERQLQAAVMKYLAAFYPKALAIHVPNEGKRSKYHAKASGIMAGVSDVLVFEHAHGFVGLVLELKLKPNRPTEKQLKFLGEIEKRKWATEIRYSFDDAKEIIDWYLKK